MSSKITFYDFYFSKVSHFTKIFLPSSPSRNTTWKHNLNDILGGCGGIFLLSIAPCCIFCILMIWTIFFLKTVSPSRSPPWRQTPCPLLSPWPACHPPCSEVLPRLLHPLLACSSLRDRNCLPHPISLEAHGPQNRSSIHTVGTKKTTCQGSQRRNTS